MLHWRLQATDRSTRSDTSRNPGWPEIRATGSAEANVWTAWSELDHVVVIQGFSGVDAASVQERSVEASEIHEDVGIVLTSNLSMARRHVGRFECDFHFNPALTTKARRVFKDFDFASSGGTVPGSFEEFEIGVNHGSGELVSISDFGMRISDLAIGQLLTISFSRNAKSEIRIPKSEIALIGTRGRGRTCDLSLRRRTL